MSMQADLLNPEMGYKDEGLSLDNPALYESACKPFGLATALPPVAYRSKTFLELESEKIWTRSWSVIGLGQQIPNAGDLLPFTLGFHGLHVQRNRDSSLAARMNRHQHGGCRFVPVQCRTGTQTKCSITACNYTRDADAMSAAANGENSDEMFKFVGLVPEKLTPVKFGTWGPFIFINLDPACAELDEQIGGLVPQLPLWLNGPLSIRTKLWIDVKANWKEMGAAFVSDSDIDLPSTEEDSHFASCIATDGPCGRARLFWAFPNLLLAVGDDHALVVLLQSTAPGKTLCRLFLIGPEALSEQRAAELGFGWIAWVKACGAAAEALHQDHVLHGTPSRPGTQADMLPLETNAGSYLLNRYLSQRLCKEHKYYWTAPIMDAAMLMRGVR